MVLRAKVTEVKKLDLRRFPFPDVFQYPDDTFGKRKANKRSREEL